MLTMEAEAPQARPDAANAQGSQHLAIIDPDPHTTARKA